MPPSTSYKIRMNRTNPGRFTNHTYYCIKTLQIYEKVWRRIWRRFSFDPFNRGIIPLFGRIRLDLLSGSSNMGLVLHLGAAVLWSFFRGIRRRCIIDELPPNRASRSILGPTSAQSGQEILLIPAKAFDASCRFDSHHQVLALHSWSCFGGLPFVVLSVR